jgi:hypothetical protein
MITTETVICPAWRQTGLAVGDVRPYGEETLHWRLLHRRHPAIAPIALIDTLRLARHLKLGAKNSLSDLTAQLCIATARRST